MSNEELEIRLKAIELSINRLAITLKNGQHADAMNGQLLYLRERIGRGDLEPRLEAIFEQTLDLLAPHSPKPGDEF